MLNTASSIANLNGNSRQYRVPMEKFLHEPSGCSQSKTPFIAFLFNIHCLVNVVLLLSQVTVEWAISFLTSKFDTRCCNTHMVNGNVPSSAQNYKYLQCGHNKKLHINFDTIFHCAKSQTSDNRSSNTVWTRKRKPWLTSNFEQPLQKRKELLVTLNRT